MRILLTLLLVGLPVVTAGQTPAAPPAQPAPAVPPAQPTPTQPARPAAPRVPVPRLSVLIFVSDTTGEPARGVTVRLTGPLAREGQTGANGQVRFLSLRPGTYRARFESPRYVTFEKEIVVRPGLDEAEATLTLAPPPPEPPPPPAAVPAQPAAAPRTLPPPADPTSMDLAAFIEKNYISNRQPQKENELGCSGDGRAVLLQLREPLENRSHDDYDEFLYTVAGEGTLTIGGGVLPLSGANGTFALVPRGQAHSIARRGRSPLMLLSIRAGAPCP